ncbi:hypothetical protein G6F57_013705 [Rhizopus arrhizus]|nr:hypothetical protein G6F23_011216 [Rhizopus arrhizus]KAG1416287.1 hypothetical protein G6F58_006054 [Rhizopus delemar]KAG0778848.1 hypothetical protein G6F22_010989 [Rhizopus arrhizus]KAG0790126.1 hypothetical protein G6F21_006028 [Rhizopus arrhizus]KAG0805464.1 hypothetical protein G6F20_011884 [Rhizopus arrhizus]
MKDEDSRKRSKNETGSYTRLWSLYVLEDKYHANVLQNILQYNEKYQGYLKEQKKLGVEIVGYVRKSPCGKDEDNRTRLIQKMVHNLRNRSIVDKVFVSKTSDADQPFHKRDINADTIEETDGTTTDFIEFLNATKKEVILVVLDYAGLTTNVEDLKEFLSEQRNITKIIVDRLPITTEVEIFETELLLQDPKAIKKFDCRTRPIQRSL